HVLKAPPFRSGAGFATERLEQFSDGLLQPSPGLPGRVVQTLDDDPPGDFPFFESFEELGIVAERPAAVRLTVGAEDVGMGEDAVAAEHLAVVDRGHPNGANAVERPLTQREIIDVRRGWPAMLHVDEARIVQVIAQAGMGLEPAAVRQVHGVRGDVINGGATVGVRGRIRAGAPLRRLRGRRRGQPRPGYPPAAAAASGGRVTAGRRRGPRGAVSAAPSAGNSARVWPSPASAASGANGSAAPRKRSLNEAKRSNGRPPALEATPLSKLARRTNPLFFAASGATGAQGSNRWEGVLRTIETP